MFRMSIISFLYEILILLRMSFWEFKEFSYQLSIIVIRIQLLKYIQIYYTFDVKYSQKSFQLPERKILRVSA